MAILLTPKDTIAIAVDQVWVLYADRVVTIYIVQPK